MQLGRRRVKINSDRLSHPSLRLDASLDVPSQVPLLIGVAARSPNSL